MSTTSHIEALRAKHATLSKQVEAAQRAPGSSNTEISRMKKEKLHLKEEITRLQTV